MSRIAPSFSGGCDCAFAVVIAAIDRHARMVVRNGFKTSSPDERRFVMTTPLLIARDHAALVAVRQAMRFFRAMEWTAVSRRVATRRSINAIDA